MRAEVASPTYLGGVWDRDGARHARPRQARLRACARAALELGVRICEHTRGRRGCASESGRVGSSARRAAACARGASCSRRAPSRRCCARSAATSCRSTTTRCDRAAQRGAAATAIGWAHRQGIGDGGNQFHYYRLTRRRPDPVRRLRRHLPLRRRRRPTSTSATRRSRMLAEHFFHTFPQLEGMRFTHRWGGAIDTCSRFSVFFGTALGGRVALRHRLHRPRRRRHAASARGSRSTCSTAATPSRPACARAHQAGAVPARAAALGGSRADAPRARARRPQRGPAQPLAQGARPDGARLRFLEAPAPPDSPVSENQRRVRRTAHDPLRGRARCDPRAGDDDPRGDRRRGRARPGARDARRASGRRSTARACAWTASS